MVVRCEHDSVLAPGTYINVKALNEWESKVRMIDSPNGVGENVVGGENFVEEESKVRMIDSPNGVGESVGGGECGGGHFDLCPHSKGESKVRMIDSPNGVGENGVGDILTCAPTQKGNLR